MSYRPLRLAVGPNSDWCPFDRGPSGAPKKRDASDEFGSERGCAHGTTRARLTWWCVSVHGRALAGIADLSRTSGELASSFRQISVGPLAL